MGSGLTDAEELLREVVMDYGERCCFHGVPCQCSMGRAIKFVKAMEEREDGKAQS